MSILCPTISMGMLSRCSLVSNIVKLHHLDFNEMLGGKARWELHNDIACF